MALSLILCGVALGGFWAIGFDLPPDEPFVVTTVGKPAGENIHALLKQIDNDVRAPMPYTVLTRTSGTTIGVTTASATAPSTMLATCVNVPSQ